MSEHEAAGALTAALRFELQELRRVAADAIYQIDDRRVVLADQIDLTPGQPLRSSYPTGPVVPRRQAERDLKRLNVQREHLYQALVRDSQQLVATAQGADYTYRQEFEGYSAAGHRLEPVEFELRPEDVGPFPDPLEGESTTGEPPAPGLWAVGDDPR